MLRASRTGSTTSGNAGPADAATSRPSSRTPGTGRPNGCASSAGCCCSRPVAPDEPSKRRRRRGEQGIRGWRSFTSVPVGDVPVDHRDRRRPHRGARRPRRRLDMRVPVALTPGWQEAPAPHRGSTSPSRPRSASSAPMCEFGIISDVDDTVMVTALPRPLLAAWNTFVLDEHARHPDARDGGALRTPRARASRARRSSTSPPARGTSRPTLTRFLSRNLYPAGPLLLTDWGPTHDRWFRSGRAHKEREPPSARRGVPRTCAGCSSATTASTTRSSTREFAAEHPDQRRRRRDPAALDRRGGARRRAHEGRTARRRRALGLSERRCADRRSALRGRGALTPAPDGGAPRFTCLAHSGPR